jgi:hypothetical protein
MDEMAVDVEQAGAVLGLVNQVVVLDFVVQRGRLLIGHGVRPRIRDFNRKKRRARMQRAGRQAASAAVVSRPKKRQGKRLRSSRTTRDAIVGRSLNMWAL